MECYACYNLNTQTRIESSSGGFFSAISNQIIDMGGIIYGIAMSEDCYSAQYIRVSKYEELELLRGSKYVQARMSKVFKLVQRDLDDNKKVLFSGTACQINALKKFLMKEYSNLLTIDVICHGVPSPELWEKYVRHQEQIYAQKIERVNFRCKHKGWKDFCMKENSIYISRDVDPYMLMFLRNYSLRPACFNCVPKKNKMSDITIGDFWGIENCAPEMDDGKGTSIIILRSDKGKEFFKMTLGKLKVVEVKYDDAIKGNPTDYASVNRPIGRDSFFIDLEKLGFNGVVKKYAEPKKVSFLKKIRKDIKDKLRYIGGGKSYKMNSCGIEFIFKNKLC